MLIRPEPKKKNKLQFKDILYLSATLLIVAGLTRVTTKNIHSRLVSQTPVVLAAQTYITKTPTPVIKYVEVNSDNRAKRLQAFLEGKQSPFSHLAAYIIQKSDENAIEWTLVVSISRIESNYGKNTDQDCHNPFGLGGRKKMCFDSWEKAIDYMTTLLGQEYKYDATQGIQEKYCPSSECNAEWTHTVVATSKEILLTNTNY